MRHIGAVEMGFRVYVVRSTSRLLQEGSVRGAISQEDNKRPG